MKRSDNTEMDRLLRRHARSKGETLRTEHAASVGVPGGIAHLDADELNAYAEGALPEAARASYFAHLADCETCRKSVTDLTLAANVAIRDERRAMVAEPSPSRSWRDWLAALFSPPVLRYGAPALVLFAVIIVAIVAMRSNRETDSVAQRSAEERNYAPGIATDSNSSANSRAETSIAENHSNSNTTASAGPQNQALPDAAATPLPARTAPTESDALPPPTQEGAPKPAIAQSGEVKDSSGEFGIVSGKRGPEPAVTSASNLPAPSAPAAAPGADSTAKREEQKKAKIGAKNDDEATFNESTSIDGVDTKQRAANEDRRDAGTTTTARRAQGQARNRPATASKSQTADVTTEKEAAAETQSVAGRRFRRQGSAWVDTAYNPSRPTTNVARGSEQYRALVADEPGLRSITQRLGGEVIVVWKSRAYRFY